MSRGGRRLGAGRPHGTSVLDEWQKIEVGTRCARLWRENIETRLREAQEAVFSKSDYRELASENRDGLRSQGSAWFETYRAEDIQDDLEGSIKEMSGQSVDSAEPAKRLLRFEVSRPYGQRARILREVSCWATALYEKKVSVGVVDSAWKLMSAVERDGSID